MKKNDIKYFLAANSCEGFYSVFDKAYLPDGEWRAYIIKGGPGTGKSSFMKRFASYAEKKGCKALRCPCSSDPDSLDAVILPDKKMIILDGTAPHTVDPSYPGVCEKILNFGEFWRDGELVLFIGGITPKGINTFTETAECEAERLVIISDRYGSASNIIINAARGYALAAGYEIITLKNPFLPSLITDHVIIPELKLAFVTENDYAKFASTERRVHSRRFVALKKLHLSSERMKFNRKAAASLLESAAATLQKAKSVHDELEAFYIGAMDFKALDSYYEDFLKNI